MLQFIYGLPSSGKTYNILNLIKKEAENEMDSVLIVPEQFSFESEKSVLLLLGDKLSRRVSVMSFSRLFDEVGRITGGIAGVNLSDSDKIIFMNRALIAVADSLKLWSKYAHSVTFAKTMLDTVGELKINSITPQKLREISIITSSDSLKNKLCDIAEIYEMYDALTCEKFIDPADNLTKLYRSLENYKYFSNKTIFLDSFKGFTGQQFKIINRILSQADNVYISLTNDTSYEKEYNIYSNIRKAVEKIKKSALRYNVKIEEPVILNKSRFNSKSLCALERLIAGVKSEKYDGKTDITICKAQTIYDEAEFAARTIRKLVRTENYRFKDFVIICRDAEKYSDAVLSSCERNNVSCFSDKRVSLSSFPVCAAVSSAILYAIKPSTEQILRFHKTGMGTLDYNEISKLENYTVLWNISGNNWNKVWTMDINGMVLDNDDKKSQDELNNLNLLRVKAITPLNHFKEKFSENAYRMSEAIINLLTECESDKALIEMSNTFISADNSFSSDVLKQSYNKFTEILDSLVRCFANRTLKKTEYSDAFNLAVSQGSVGVIPQMLDEVTFGSADRIRPQRPKIAFILGANQGVFPMLSSETGIFSLFDRKQLIESGIEISDRSIYAAVDENFLVYTNLCCASESVYISYAANSLSGDALEPSAFVSEIEKNINCNNINEPQKLNINSLPETEESTFSEFCKSYYYNSDDALTFKEGINNNEIIKRINTIESSVSEKERKLNSDIAINLFGKDIQMSASKFDIYHKCKFSFFCKYGIRAKRIQPADFDTMQRGTVIHYVLEKIISTYKKKIVDMEPSKLDSLTDNYIKEYFDNIKGYRDFETARSRFIVSKISRSLKEVVRQISKEFAQSKFEPVSCELKIGNGGDIPAIAIPFDKGNILLNGSIDRVDEYNGYVRIVDYKSGQMDFKLPDILFGLNLQMLIYLYVVIRGKNIPDDKAAGILYMISKRDLNESGMAMNGLLKSDKDILTAMEKDNNGEFIPKLKTNKDGSISKVCNSFISSEEFSDIFNYIEKIIKDTGNDIVKGDISINPIDGMKKKACIYCDYKSICGIENKECNKVLNLKNDEVFKKIKEATADEI